MGLKTFIYGLVSKDTPEHIRYVGKTVNIDMRLNAHLSKAKGNEVGPPVHDWIRDEMFEIEAVILDEVSTDDWVLAEQSHIDQLTLEGYNLLNVAKAGGGGSSGEDNGNATLTEEIVIEGRIRAHNGEFIRNIADDLEIPFPTLYDSIKGKTWSILNAIMAPKTNNSTKGRSKNVRGNRTMTYARAQELRAKHAEGATVASIARNENLSETAVGNIIKRKTYKKP